MTTRPPLVRHAIAVATVLATFLAKEPIEDLIGPGPPLIFFVPAVTISAWQGGAGPGLLATALVSLLCSYYFFPPIGSLKISQPNDIARLLAFILEGVLTSITMEWLHRARRQAELSGREAERFRETSRRADELLRAVVDNTDAIIYLKDQSLNYIMMNRKLREILGLAPGDSAGVGDRDVFPGGVAGEIRANDRAVLEGGRAIESVERIPLADGPRDYVSLRFPLLDAEGVPRAVGCVSTDITPLKQAQRRAVQAERLAAIGQMAAGLAHEGRNALQRSQSCLEMLARRVADRPEALDLVAGIQQAQDDLHRLYEEVRGYAAPIVLDRRPRRIGELVSEAWARLASDRDGRAAILRLRELGEPGLSAPVDGFRLIQVFRIILENALAAAPDPVEVVAEWSEVEGVGSGAGSVSVVIRDNGPGLSPEARTRLFEPFFTTKARGTGLGMAIARRIIEAHGGAIVADPGEGRGTSIRITLPRGLTP